MTDGFVFYRSFIEAMEDLPPEQFKDCMTALCRYALDGDSEGWTGTTKMLMTLVKPQIDANLRRRENGGKGGRPRKQNLDETKEKPSNNLDETKVEPNVTEAEPKVKEKVKAKEKVKDESIYLSISDAWNTLPDSVPKPRLPLNETRRRKVDARIKEYGLDAVLQAIKDAGHSKFLTGQSSSWHMTFDWFMEPKNLAKVIEGNYTDRGTRTQNGFTSMQNNSYDWDTLEQQLLAN